MGGRGARERIGHSRRWRCLPGRLRFAAPLFALLLLLALLIVVLAIIILITSPGGVIQQAFQLL